MKTRTPSYRLHRPTGLAVVTLNGRDHYLGKHGSPESREEYDRLIAEWLVNGRRASEPAQAPANGLTVNEMLVSYWHHAESHYRAKDGTPSEELGNIKAALRPLKALYGRTVAKDFGPLALRAVRDEMVRSNLARTSINSRVNRIRRAFKWAASVELVPVAVVQTLATVAGLQRGRSQAREKEPIGPVSLDRVEAVLPFLPRPVAGLVRLQLLTGMRPGEACAMRGRDLKPGETNWIYTPASHKTEHHGKRRVIPLGPKAVSLVKEFLTTNGDDYLFSPAEAVSSHHARRSASRKSTPSEKTKRSSSPGANHAKRYRRNAYRNAISRACDKAFPHPTLPEIKPRRLTEIQKAELEAWRRENRWHPNQIRHYVATEIRAKFGLEAAQTVLGHSKADVTQVYAERDLTKAHEVMLEVG